MTEWAGYVYVPYIECDALNTAILYYKLYRFQPQKVIIRRGNVTELKRTVVKTVIILINLLNPELNLVCYLLALLGAHHFLHVSRIRVKLLTLRLLMSYIYGAPILDVSRSHATTQHSR